MSIEIDKNRHIDDKKNDDKYVIQTEYLPPITEIFLKLQYS